MAKKSMVNRDLKRAKLIKQHAGKRADLKKIIASADAGYDEKMAAQPPTSLFTFLPTCLAQSRHVAAHGRFAQLAAGQAELHVHGARTAGQRAAGAQA